MKAGAGQALAVTSAVEVEKSCCASRRLPGVVDINLLPEAHDVVVKTRAAKEHSVSLTADIGSLVCDCGEASDAVSLCVVFSVKYSTRSLRQEAVHAWSSAPICFTTNGLGRKLNSAAVLKLQEEYRKSAVVEDGSWSS